MTAVVGSPVGLSLLFTNAAPASTQARGFPFFLFRVGSGSVSPVVPRDIDGVLTKKQLEALRRKLKRARLLRDAEDERRRSYIDEIKHDVEVAFGVAAPDQQEEIVEALPKVSGDTEADETTPLYRVDWNALIIQQKSVNDLRKALGRLASELSLMDAKRQDEDDIAILLMAME